MYHYLDYIPQWKHIASDVGDVIFVKPLVECIIGADLITGEELDGYERGMKLVVAVVDVTGIGLAARAGAGLGIKGASEVVMVGMTTDALSTINADVTQMFVKDMGGSDEAANLAGLAAGWATGAASDKILGNSLYNTVTNVNGINGGMADDLIEGGSKTIDDLIGNLKETTNGKGIARNFESSGGFEQTLKDFDSFSPIDVKNIQTQYGLGKFGRLSDGTTVVARPGSTTGGATLEIKVSNSKVFKIRY